MRLNVCAGVVMSCFLAVAVSKNPDGGNSCPDNACAVSPEVPSAVADIRSFRWKDIVDRLPTICPVDPGLASTCWRSRCESLRKRVRVRSSAEIMSWVCARKAGFEASRDCWSSSDFRKEMKDCTPAGHRRKLMACVTGKINGMTSCDTEAKILFRGLMEHVHDTYLSIVAEMDLRIN